VRVLLPLLIVCAIGVGGAAARAGQGDQPTAPELAARLQKRYESIRDFTADFTQTYRGVLQRKTATERGKVLIKKPNRVRFTYEAPEKKVFDSDGTTFRSYYQEDRAGSEYPLPKENEASTALLFLAGRGNLARDFNPGIAEGAPPTEWHLGLVPVAKQADFDTLTLFVDRRSLALLGFQTTDAQGTNIIRFTNLKENTGVPDSAFVFTFPPGTAISR
jgi:outer membrane lipoprotein carrier protein